VPNETTPTRRVEIAPAPASTTLWENSGPPESPWHESLPPSTSPAQIILESTVAPYATRHALAVTTGTCTVRSTLVVSPPSTAAPHPLVHSAMPARSSCDASYSMSDSMTGFMLTALLSCSSATSLALPA
jgi:hypothetical protein